MLEPLGAEELILGPDEAESIAMKFCQEDLETSVDNKSVERDFTISIIN